MTQVRMAVLTATIGILAACASSQAPLKSDSGRPLVRYSYTGPPMTVFTGVVAPWTTESRITGYFIAEELPPSYTTDFLDPDIHWPFPNLPAKFAFTDGARTITRENIEDVMENTGDRLDPTMHEVRTFSVTTDGDGNIVSWDILFVHDVRRNVFLTTFNGGMHGQDRTEVDATHFGCVASEKCTGNANYTLAGPVLPDTQLPGTWTRAIVQAPIEDGT